MKHKIKYQIAFSILFILSGFKVSHGQVTQEWFARYNGPGNGLDQGNSMEVDASGNIYVTGSSIGNGTAEDYTTIKYNSAGIEQWVQRYNGPGNSVDEAYDIALDASGNVYVTGRSRLGSTEYTYDYATIKYNSSGDQQWVVIYNSGTSDEAYAITLDESGNVYVTGQAGLSQLNANFATIKYNSSGVQQWVATYDGPGASWDRGLAITVDETHNVYVTGSYSIEHGTAYMDYATIKYDSNGIQQWLTTYNGTANNSDVAVAIGLDASGNVYITGYSTGTVYDIVTIKYNAAGIQQWFKIFSSSGSSVDVPTSMIVDDAGNLYITGACSFNYGTIKYNTDGVQQWLATYDATGNFDAANAIAIDSYGNVFVTGVSSSGFLENTQDYATIKYNSDGVQQWLQRHNGTGNDWDEANSIAVDQSGNVYVTGYSSVSGSTDFGTIKYSLPVGVQPVSNEIPNEFELFQNYPNPFNPVTKIKFDIPPDARGKTQDVKLVIYNAIGKEVETLVNESLSSGSYQVTWNAERYSSGIYFYTIQTAGLYETKKMILTK